MSIWRFGRRVTPLFLIEQAEPVESVAEEIENRVLLNLARFFKGKPDDWKRAPLQWQARKLAQLGALNTENIQTISRLAGREESLYMLALEKTLWRALGEVDLTLSAALKKGKLSGTPGALEETIARQLDLLREQAANKLNLVNTVMLNSSLEQAQKVIANTMAYERQLSQAQAILNDRAGEVVTGVTSLREAVSTAVKDMALEGLTGFTDRAGRRWSPEAYVSMDLRTTAHNAATQAVFDRCDEYGCSLVEVSEHAGARPRCEPYQGKIYNRAGGAGATTDGNGKTVHYGAWSETSYGEPAGLLGINCGHFVYPFIPGFSSRTFEPTRDKKLNDQQYELSQTQRRLERDVRAAKREAALLKAAGDSDGAAKARERVKAKSSAVRDFCNQTGRKRRNDRERVPGLDWQ